MNKTKAFVASFFKLQAVLLLAFWGFHMIVPLAVSPFVSAVWMIFGVGVLLVARGIHTNKKWASYAALLGTTLPYFFFVITMQLIQRRYMIWEGPKNTEVAIPLIVWVVVLLNLVASVMLLSSGEEVHKIEMSHND